jgi:hypothetical protein
MVPITLTTGGSTLWPLSQFFVTFRAAQRFHEKLAKTHPRCSVQCTCITLDPSNPYHRGAINEHKRQLVVETLQNGQ